MIGAFHGVIVRTSPLALKFDSEEIVNKGSDLKSYSKKIKLYLV